MKKSLLFVAVAALSVGTLVSCGKSSKGKMDGEWNIDSKSSVNTYTDNSGTSSNSTTIEGSMITKTSTGTNGTSTTKTGTVSSAVWNIKKDGTWDKTITYTITGNNSSETSSTVSSGKWDFAAGVGEFKKNERVLFSTLSETSTSSTTVGNLTITGKESDTYLDGENSEIYVITESKKKSLQLEYKSSNGNTSGNSATETNGNTTTYKLTLK